MVQLQVLSGKRAGTGWVARRFPVRIGRGPGADLQSDEDGVWEEHVLLEFQPHAGFQLRTQGEALASVNGQPVQEVFLRNGDLIEMGGLKLQFWLSETRQPRLSLGEALAWVVVGLVLLLQLGLLYWLLSGLDAVRRFL
jgi:pSer/pThr/pTyr-binding forkhead associated (FHA) protein